MLAHVGVIGRALKREVERDLDTQLAGRRQQVTKLFQGAELGVDCLVATFAAADGPGTARVPLLRLLAIVRAFALGRPDRMDGREVQHVESHRCDVGEEFLDVSERAVPLGIVGRRAREHLVPGRVSRALTIDVDRERLAFEHRVRIGIASRQLLQPLTLCQCDPFFPVACAVRNRMRPLLQATCVPLRSAAGDGAGKRAALLQIQLGLLLNCRFFEQPAAPAVHVIDPGADGVQVAPEQLDAEARAPAVVAQEHHGQDVPLGRAFMPIQEVGGDRVMAVREHIRLDVYGFAKHPLGREAAAVDLRSHIFDDDANLAHPSLLLDSPGG